jgi:oxygen-dependent protoporphyrinogen oxidase
MLRNAGNGAGATGVSGARYSLFLSFDRGMQALVDQLTRKIADSIRVDIRVNTKVERLARASDNKWIVTMNDGLSIEADAVCLAVPSYTAATLLNEDSSLAAKLNQIRFASTATVNLAYRREDIAHPLDGFGFVVPFVEKRSLLACTFSSVKFPERAPNGHVLLRAFVGGALQPDMFELDDDKMLARVKSDLRELLGIQREPLFTETSKWANSMPQYEVGHLERLERIEKQVAQLPGLFLAGNAYRGAGIPDCIRSGEQAAEGMVGYSSQ